MSLSATGKSQTQGAKWATVSVVYSCITVAILAGCLLPGLAFVALGAVMVGFDDDPLLLRFTIEFLALALTSLGPIIAGFVVEARHRKPTAPLSWKTITMASCLPIVPGVVLFADTVATDSYWTLFLAGPTLLSVLGAWIPVVAACAIEAQRLNVRGRF